MFELSLKSNASRLSQSKVSLVSKAQRSNQMFRPALKPVDNTETAKQRE
jgi:hypothetical protein